MTSAARVEAGPTVMVRIDSLVGADSPRLAGESIDHARALAESDAVMPPIVVHRRTMRVIDGMHRVRACVIRGQDEIEVQFFDGSVEDAFVLAVEANVVHGLPLSRADRTAAAVRILRSHPQWSNRTIASVTGLSGKTVGAIRQRATAEIPQSYRRVGRDGRVRPLSTSQGRRLAGELMVANPGASLREIGRVANVSTGTVRDVRDRLRRGEDPVPAKQREANNRRDQGKGARARTGGSVVRLAGKDPGSVLANLRKDPSLRFTEDGRLLLRLLDVFAIESTLLNRLADNVPDHCLGLVAELAGECAGVWQTLAEHLRQRQSTSA